MQNTYAIWRATHPLVFITVHLLTGILMANYLPPFLSKEPQALAIFILVLSLILLFFLSRLTQLTVFSFLIIFITLIGWGIAIQMVSKTVTLFKIPYPTNLISTCRNWVITKINNTILVKEANGFALAILLGVKMDMEKNLVTAYTQLGIIHIIAISGMHLEILFKNLQKITQLLPRRKIFLYIELCILLIVVWIYTCMAFASPSIVRAAVFFSIYKVGKFIGASPVTLNTIAGGVLILLLFDTNQLQNIGLQLSYAAVIGIHLFYKMLYKSIALNNPIIQFLWSNCCVSLSVQLTTLPILALHFHQIAGWVLVSNFIMVPLSNFILYGLAILLLLPMKYQITEFWGKIVTEYITYFNHFVQNWFLQTAAESIQITFNGKHIVLYYLLLLCLYLWLYLKRQIWLLTILGLLIIYFLQKLFSY